MKIFISAKVHDGFLLITIFDKALSLEIAEAMKNKERMGSVNSMFFQFSFIQDGTAIN